MSKWRDLGLTYIQFSNIAAQVLRNSLKSELKVEAAKRSTSNVKFTKWEAGKANRTATSPTPE